MITDFETNTIYFSELLRSEKWFEKTFKDISEVLKSFGIAFKFLPKTKDIWARDYMPIQVAENKYIEYRYDPNYLQGDSDHKETREYKTYPDIVCDAIGLKTIKTDVILDGGNVVKHKNTVILTNKVIWENCRNYTQRELTKTLHELFEVDKIVFIPWDEECKYGHSDGMLRFINNNTVLISGFYETADEEFKTLIQKSLEKSKLDWYWLRVSEKEKEENIAYINFLQTKDLILIPSLNKREDETAFEQLSKYYPDYKSKNRIAKVDMRDIVKYQGALNCITWTTKE